MKVPVVPNFSEQGTHEHGQVVTCGKHDIHEGKSDLGASSLRLLQERLGLHWGLNDLDLEISLNYGQAKGVAPLVRFVTEHTEVRRNLHMHLGSVF